IMNDRFYVKIIPHKGDVVHRFLVRRRHVTAVASAILVVVLGSLAFAGMQVLQAHAQVSSLRRQTERQRSALRSIDDKTNALRAQLQRVQKQNQEIQSLIGAPSPHPVQTSWVRRGTSLAAVAADLQALS